MKRLIPLLLIVFMSGCATIPGFGTVPMKTTRITIDPETKVETTVIEEPAQPTPGGFFKSENLEEHYKFETARVDKHERTANRKIEAIQENVNKAISVEGTTATERYMFALNANLLIDRIQTSPGPSGVKAPIVAGDVLDKNLVGGLNLALGIWDRVDARNSRGDDSKVEISNTGDGTVFYQSDKNNFSQQTTKYTLGNSTGDVSLASPSLTPANAYTDSNDVNNTRNDSANSETSTLW